MTSTPRRAGENSPEITDADPSRDSATTDAQQNEFSRDPSVATATVEPPTSPPVNEVDGDLPVGALADALEAPTGTEPGESKTPGDAGVTAVEATGEADAEEETKPRPFQALIDLLHDLAIAVVVCVLLITYVVQAFKVQGTSMSPELLNGERILVNKFLYYFGDVDRGDVVVFWYPEDPELSFIKRVVGLPGERIEIKNGAVYVNDELVEEDYVLPANADGRSLSAREIRPGHYFVLGDNRRGSNDSRSWGFVPRRYIYGKAFVRIWPPSDIGIVD